MPPRIDAFHLSRYISKHETCLFSSRLHQSISGLRECTYNAVAVVAVFQVWSACHVWLSFQAPLGLLNELFILSNFNNAFFPLSPCLVVFTWGVRDFFFLFTPIFVLSIVMNGRAPSGY
jgi:hypothetical protein